MDNSSYYLDSDQNIYIGPDVMKVQRSSTLPAIHSADKNDKNKSERRTSRTFHSEERPITKQTNPYLLKIWKSRSLSRRHVDRRLVFKVDDATPEAVKR